jgi:hypothetical protein
MAADGPTLELAFHRRMKEIDVAVAPEGADAGEVERRREELRSKVKNAYGLLRLQLGSNFSTPQVAGAPKNPF